MEVALLPVAARGPFGFNDVYWPYDVFRIFLAAACFWLAALTLRIGWMRHRRNQEEAAHPAVHTANAVMLVMLGLSRVQYLGHGPVWQMWATALVVALTFYGVTRRHHLPTKPPHTRDPNRHLWSRRHNL